MACDNFKPVYAPQKMGGLNLAASRSDGNQIALEWDKAYASAYGNQILYNIYFSTSRYDIIEEGVKYVSVDPTYLNTCVPDLPPGQQYFFIVRAAEYDLDWYDPNQLQDGPDGLKIYTESILLSNISESDLAIPVSDIDLWPSYGIAQVGTELIRYSSKDIPNNTLIVAERGFGATNIRIHNTDGYDGVAFRDPVVRFFKGYEDDNFRVQMEMSTFFQPNAAFTFADGYATNTDKLTGDFTSSDADLADFPKYDQVGWHRTDPKNIVQGKCIGTYIGGEQWCADGYLGIGRQTRGIPLSEQALRREELLLDSTGQEFMLIRRIWEGIRCPCVLATNEQPNKRCHKCFVPGTLINTENGYKKIEEINIGEKVLTHDGSFQRVTEVMKNHHVGEISSIYSSVNAEPILCTTDHPIWVLRGNHQQRLNSRKCGPKCNHYINNGDGLASNKGYDVRQLPSGNWHARLTNQNGIRHTLGSFSSKSEAINAIDGYKAMHFVPGHHIVWNDAKNVTHGDWVVAQFPKKIVDRDYIAIPPKYLKNTNLGQERLGPKGFDINPDFLWMIGLYIAEGSSSSRTVVFALHYEEIEYQTRLINYFENLGFNPKMRQVSDNGCVVEINSTTLSQWLSDWVGKYCHKKAIPNELIYLPNNKIQFIIQGIWDGDGNKSCNEIGQTSEILALQLSDILHRLGYQPLIRKQTSNKLTPNGNRRKQCYIVSWEESTLTNHNRKNRWQFKNNALSKVKETAIKNYDGYVYNLEIENNHTYIVQGVVVHNCFGTGFSTGYDQYYNPRRSDGRILLRPGPYPDDLKFYDAGLESEAILELWTLPVPSIKVKDVLIRYSRDGTEEFRYEVIQVTRNLLFDQVLGVQKIRAQRIRKTSPIYQWRAIASTATMPTKVTTSIGMLRGPSGTMIPHTHEIVINEGIVSLGQVNQTTSVVEGHNHIIKDGIIQSEFGHTHTIILP